MKRIASLLALILTMVGASAQSIDLEPGQYILGNSTSDEYVNYAQAPTIGDVLVASGIDGSSYKNLKNCRALGIRFCVPQRVKVRNIKLFPNDVDDAAHTTTKEVGAMVDAGWNYITFDEPVTLDPKGCFISYTYAQTATNYGICNWPDVAYNGFWIYVFDTKLNRDSWKDFSSYYGAVCIQLIVEADLPDYDVRTDQILPAATALGEPATPVAQLVSNSKKAIDNFDYKVVLGETTTTRHIDFATPVQAGVDNKFAIDLNFPVPDASGDYKATFSITHINGEAVVSPVATEFSQRVLTRKATRRSVVEEFTGTGCGNCPRGWAGMEYMKEKYPYTFCGIAIHQYNQGDPMYNGVYARHGMSAAPACRVNRDGGTVDPYYGIEDAFLSRNAEMPLVDLSVWADYNADRTAVEANCAMEYLFDASKYTLAFVLTADGLRGKTAAWNQSNYLVGKDPSSMNVMDNIPVYAEFGNGGKYNQSSVRLTYNDVMIGSTYTSTGASTAPTLPSKGTAGQTLNRTSTISMPTNELLLPVLDYNKIYVTAIITDAEGRIINAARCRVGDPEGISTTTTAQTTPAQAYDLQGRAIKGHTRGITIQGGRKILY